MQSSQRSASSRVRQNDHVDDLLNVDELPGENAPPTESDEDED